MGSRLKSVSNRIFVPHADDLLFETILERFIAINLIKSFMKSVLPPLPVVVLAASTCHHLPKLVPVLACFHMEGHTAGQNTECAKKMAKAQVKKMIYLISPSVDLQSPLESLWSVTSHLWSSFRIPRKKAIPSSRAVESLKIESWDAQDRGSRLSLGCRVFALILGSAHRNGIVCSWLASRSSISFIHFTTNADHVSPILRTTPFGKPEIWYNTCGQHRSHWREPRQQGRQSCVCSTIAVWRKSSMSKIIWGSARLRTDILVPANFHKWFSQAITFPQILGKEPQ